MSASWTPRRYEPVDDPKIAALLRLCYPRHQGLEYWAWMLNHSPLGFHGPEGDIWVAETRAGDLVGYYGRIRVPMRFRGAPIVGSQVAMLATHPDYRRQGVFERLAAAALEDAKKNGIGVTFGFPNEFSYPGSVKHGWVDYGRVKDLT
jgi:GNAT superfamily N-acetyltransferase